MAIPRMIEFIESLIGPGGGFIAEHGGSQVIIPVFPPHTRLSYQLSPHLREYALIAYEIMFSPVIVPDCFEGTIHHSGKNKYRGILSSAMLNSRIESYGVVTASSPLTITIENITGLNQYGEAIAHFLPIATSEDYKFILDALDDLANKGDREFRSEALKYMQFMQSQHPGGQN